MDFALSIGDIIGQFAMDKKPVEPAPVKQWFGDLQQWIEKDYDKLVHPPRTPGLHASGLGKVCARRSMLISAFGFRERPLTAGNFFTFDVGHSLHYWWQHRYLGPKQELIGDWACMACPCPDCEELVRKKKALTTTARRAIFDKCSTCRGTGRKVTRGLMPMNCSCGVAWQEAIQYLELPVENKELGYTGHSDGILAHQPKHRVFEFKTASPTEYEKIEGDGPKMEHIIQAHAYMGPFGLDETIIVYENKGSQCKWKVNMFGQFEAGEPRLAPFLIKYDHDLWAKVVARIKDHYRAEDLLRKLAAEDRRAGPPEISEFVRVCDNNRCELAERCPVSRECFQLD
jgi:hypothetical protein